jgi:hypothetical protein
MRTALFLTVACLALLVPSARAASVEQLERDVAELRRVVATLQSQLDAVLRDAPPAESPLDRALREAEEGAAAPASSAASSGAPPPARPWGRSDLRLIDISLDVLTSAGASTAENDLLLDLQGGGHDPRQRGFNLQAVELSFMGAVDPWLTGEVNLVYFLDEEGESQLEIEEAFATTQALPYDLQLEFGHFYTEFGRLNPRHPHAWTFSDQPVILSRLLGPDGARNPGARLSWLAPVPWFAELSLGSQLAKGETMLSYLASDEAFDERPVGGLDFFDRDTQSLNDLVWLARLANGFDVGEQWTAQLGLSGLFGPNASGPDGKTQVWGADLMAKWRPSRHRRGWPFLLFESEYLYRRYTTDEEPSAVGTLRDWGTYAQLLWGFHERWATGLRFEYASGSGDGVTPRSADPWRSDRLRLSSLFTFYQSELARWRVQYNYDRARFDLDSDEHSLWFVLEFGFGAHPAHTL